MQPLLTTCLTCNDGASRHNKNRHYSKGAKQIKINRKVEIRLLDYENPGVFNFFNCSTGREYERKVQRPIKLRHAAGRNFYSPERFISNAARGKQAHLHKAISTFSDK
jgi:hypothetical protein